MNATFWEHVDALRRALILSLISIALGIAFCLFFYQEIFAWITQPLQTNSLLSLEIKRERHLNSGTADAIYTSPANASVQLSGKVKPLGDNRYLIPPGAYLDVDSPTRKYLVLFGPMEGMLTTFKVTFWVGLLLSSPLWASAWLRFILPALYSNEKRLLLAFLWSSLLALLGGCLFAYKITIPFANQYLQSFNANIGTNLWSLSHYLDYTLMLMVANGFAFEIGLALFFLVHAGILRAEWMVEKRRHMIVVAFILGALLTPPDVPTQLMLAIPLICLYELAICYAKFKGRARE